MLNDIITEFEKVREKDSATKKGVKDLISGLKNELKAFEAELQDASRKMTDINAQEANSAALQRVVTKVNEMDVNKNFNAMCNNFYGGLSKLGKIMAKNMESESMEDFHLFEYDKYLFYTIITKDLYRRGDFNTADSLIKESKIQFDQNFRYIFNDLNLITRDLKNKNIDTLIDWCNKYYALLDNMKSNLHFESLKLKYILLLKTKSASECVEFSKKNFTQYMGDQKHFEQISKIMTMLIFKNKLNLCPYHEYKEDILWNKVTTMFINDCCTILNLPNESGFYLSTLAGMISLPQILKAEKILKSKKEIINEKELPYEIHLPNQLKFHNLFICPVTKEISTPENPPMLLTCGHAVSQNALEKMQKGSSSINSSQIKCPTCPNVQNIKDAQKLFIF